MFMNWPSYWEVKELVMDLIEKAAEPVTAAQDDVSNICKHETTR